MKKSQELDPENPFFEVFVCPELGILRCGGIEIFGEYSSLFSCYQHLNYFEWFISYFLKVCIQTPLAVERLPVIQFWRRTSTLHTSLHR